MTTVKTHGQSETALYRVWTAMRQRCGLPTRTQYADYGGRGITVCDRWRESFETFAADMGPRPPGALIERVNNDGNYTPENCRWATRLEQGRNKRNNVLVTIRGERMIVNEASRRYNIPRWTLIRAHRKGLSLDALIETWTPVTWPLTHCRRGHAFTKENTVTKSNRPRSRCCRICKLEATRAWHARQKQSV